MPWGPRDAKTRKAKSPKLRRQWAHIANSVLKRTGNEGRAVRSANAVIARQARKTKRKSSRQSSRR